MLFDCIIQFIRDGQEMQSYQFQLSQSARRYDGQRTWFICPYCCNQRTKLHMKSTRFEITSIRSDGLPPMGTSKNTDQTT